MRSQESASTVGVNDGDVILLLGGGSVRGIRSWFIETLTGSVKVFGALSVQTDGTPNYLTRPIVLSQEPNVTADVVTETEGTYTAVTTAGRLAEFFGEYKALKFVQKGATGASCRVYGSEST